MQQLLPRVPTLTMTVQSRQTASKTSHGGLSAISEQEERSTNKHVRDWRHQQPGVQWRRDATQVCKSAVKRQGEGTRAGQEGVPFARSQGNRHSRSAHAHAHKALAPREACLLLLMIKTFGKLGTELPHPDKGNLL